MTKQDVFVSVVLPVENRVATVEARLRALHEVLQRSFRDFEILVIDNGSTDDTAGAVLELQKRLENINFFRLARRYPEDTRWIVGLDNCIGDYVVTLDFDTDPAEAIPPAVEKARQGFEVVYGEPDGKDHRGHRLHSVFYRFFNSSTGFHVPTHVTRFKVLSRRVVNFITRNKDRSRLYKVLPAIGGFRFTTHPYAAQRRPAGLGENLRQLWGAFYIIVSTSQKPLRLVTSAALLASALSSIYILFVLITFLTRDNLAPGWVSISLLGGGLSFLLFLCLVILSEYLYQIIQMNRDLPPYFIADETTSRTIPKEMELNVVSAPPPAKQVGTQR